MLLTKWRLELVHWRSNSRTGSSFSSLLPISTYLMVGMFLVPFLIFLWINYSWLIYLIFFWYHARCITMWVMLGLLEMGFDVMIIMKSSLWIKNESLNTLRNFIFLGHIINFENFINDLENSFNYLTMIILITLCWKPWYCENWSLLLSWTILITWEKYGNCYIWLFR